MIRYNTCDRNGSAMTATLRGGGIAVVSSPNVEIYGNTVTNNKHGIAINQDSRGSGTYGLYEVRNLYVHDNTVTMNVGYTGLGGTAITNAYYTTKNNRFVNNTYHLGVNTKYFYWQKATRTEAEWQAYGQDATGTFTG